MGKPRAHRILIRFNVDFRTAPTRVIDIVTALDEVACCHLDKESFRSTLQHRPEIAEGMSHLLTDRKLHIDAIREGLTQSAMHQRAAGTHQALLNRIRTFFTLR